MPNLYQSEYWHDASGTPHVIDDMNLRYVDNIINYLKNRASQLKESQMWEFITGPQPRGDMACDALDAAFHQMEMTDPIDWLNETPLMEALLERKEALEFAT